MWGRGGPFGDRCGTLARAFSKDRRVHDTNFPGDGGKQMKHLSRAERRRRAREGSSAPASSPAAPSKTVSPRPAPARPVLTGPAARLGGRSRRQPAWVWWLAGAAALVIIAVGAWWALSPRTAAQGGPTLQGDRVPYEGNTHVPMGSDIQYRAHPPASGNHYPTPAPRGVYPEGLLEGFWVHSLEHGYIVLAYRPPVSPDQIQQFQNMVQTFPKSKYGYAKLVIVPYKDMAHPYAVLAWTWRLWLDQFDREKILEFYRAHVDRGPEDIP
jgi:hypothetical protein